MTLTCSSTTPAVLVDTCVISGFVRDDMNPDDAAAFLGMVEMVRHGQLTICGSTVALEELGKIPDTYRAAHLKEYKALQQIRASNAKWLDTNPASTAFGTEVPHADYRTLRGILKDKNDARLIFQAKMAGIRDFVTVDYKSILNKSDDLASQLGVRAVSPSQYLSSNLKSA